MIPLLQKNIILCSAGHVQMVEVDQQSEYDEVEVVSNLKPAAVPN